MKLTRSQPAVPSDDVPTPLFPNLSWKKQPPSTLASEPARKADLKGLKNVPTGPSSQLYPGDSSFKRQPHLFVSKTSVPVRPTTAPHIKALMAPMKPSDVHFDDTGYFITFSDDAEGRERLKLCADKYRTKLLFGKHRLVLSVFEHGQPSSCQPHVASVGDQDDQDTSPTGIFHLPSVSDKDARFDSPQEDGETDDAMPTLSRTQMASSEAVSGESTTILDSNLDALQALLPSAVESSLPLPTGSLLLTARGDKDDSASVLSGTTSSSRSRAHKCHVCLGVGGAIALTKCATCSRRFHGKCLPSSTDSTKELGRWQCQRCKKKGVPMKRTYADMRDYTTENEAEEVPKEPLHKRARQSMGYAPAKAQLPGVTALPDKASELGTTVNEVTEPEQRAHIPTTTDEAASMTFDTDVNDGLETCTELGVIAGESFAEAQKLVDQSFGQTEHSEPVVVDHMPNKGKLKLLKRAKGSERPADGADAEIAVPNPDARTKTNVSTARVRAPAVTPAPAVTHVQTQSSNHTKAVQKPSSLQEHIEVPEADIDQPIMVLAQESGHAAKPSVVVESDPMSAIPADSLLRPRPPQKRSLGKIQPTRQAIGTCTSCKTSRVVLMPSGQSICQGCRNTASGASDAAATTQVLSNGRNNNSKSTSAPYDPAAHSAADVDTHRETPKPAPETRPTATSVPSQIGHEEHEADVGDADGGDRPSESDSPLSEVESFTLDDSPPRDTMTGQREVELSTPPKQQHVQRQSYRVQPVDKNDLGNSFKREKGTYIRLIALALTAMPGNRGSAPSVVQWVHDNIPNYDKSKGNWNSGLRATMKLNSDGKNGQKMCQQVKVSTLEDGESKEYELLPGLADELEHWDSVLQQPRSPLKSHRRSLADVRAGATEGRAQSRESTGQQSKAQLEDTSDMDLCEQPLGSKETVEQESSDDDVPLSRRRRSKHPITLPATAGTSISTSDDQEVEGAKDVDAVSGPLNAAHEMPSRTSDEPEPYAGPSREDERACQPKEEEDDPELLELIQRKNREVEYNKKSLYDVWPEFDPRHHVDTAAKMAEIALRPRRKQLLGKAALHSPLGPQPFLRARQNRPEPAQASPSKRSKPVLDEDDATTITAYDTVDEFLGLTNEFVPVVHEKQLAFKQRSGPSRVFYKTGF